jgi:hypothetical protein
MNIHGLMDEYLEMGKERLSAGPFGLHGIAFPSSHELWFKRKTILTTILFPALSILNHK